MTKYEQLITKSNDQLEAEQAAHKSVVAHAQCNSKLAYLDSAIAINAQNVSQVIVADTFNVERVLELRERGAELKAQRDALLDMVDDLFS